VDRRWTLGIERSATVPVNGSVALWLVLRTARRERTESKVDAAVGRAVHEHAILRRAQDDGCAQQTRLCRQSETSPATTAADGTGGDLSKTEFVEARSWASHLSLPVAPRRHHAAQSGVVDRHHIYPAAHGFHLSGRGHGLVQPLRTELGNLDEPRRGILLLGSGPCLAAWSSRHFQHRSRCAIHQRLIYRSTGSQEYLDQHGWPGTRPGQCFRRAAVANRQIRRRLSQGLQRPTRRAAKSAGVLQLLQWPASSSSTELSNAGSRLLWHSEETKEAATRQYLLMSFKGMGKSIRTMEAPTSTVNASPHLSNEFPAGYSLTRCSPAELVSASPAGDDDASSSVQIGGFLSTIETENQNSTGSESTLKGQFFCPKNGEYLRMLGSISPLIESGHSSTAKSR
jgi:hypothetical protein